MNIMIITTISYFYGVQDYKLCKLHSQMVEYLSKCVELKTLKYDFNDILINDKTQPIHYNQQVNFPHKNKVSGIP